MKSIKSESWGKAAIATVRQKKTQARLEIIKFEMKIETSVVLYLYTLPLLINIQLMRIKKIKNILKKKLKKKEYIIVDGSNTSPKKIRGLF